MRECGSVRVWECQLTAHPRRLQNPPSLIGMPAALPVPGWVGQKRKGKEKRKGTEYLLRTEGLRAEG